MPSMRAAQIVHQPDVMGGSIVLDLGVCPTVETVAEARAAVAQVFPDADWTLVQRLPDGDWLVPVPDDVVERLDRGFPFYGDTPAYSIMVDADA